MLMTVSRALFDMSNRSPPIDGPSELKYRSIHRTHWLLSLLFLLYRPAFGASLGGDEAIHAIYICYGNAVNISKCKVRTNCINYGISAKDIAVCPSEVFFIYPMLPNENWAITGLALPIFFTLSSLESFSTTKQ